MDKQDLRRKLLPHLLSHVVFDGWSESALKNAARDAGLECNYVIIAFPEGPAEALTYWVGQTDEAMQLHAGNNSEFQSLSVRRKIAFLIHSRLEYLRPHKEAVRRGTAFFSLPWHTHHAMRSLCSTIDTIWILAGDTSSDYNWYTKRTLLAGVYTSTLLFWLTDKSDGHKATWEFLDNRIENVMQVGKLISFRKQA